ncbi:hypothetical protein ACQJBY_035643 [Aegilops geniculata]
MVDGNHGRRSGRRRVLSGRIRRDVVQANVDDAAMRRPSLDRAISRSGKGGGLCLCRCHRLTLHLDGAGLGAAGNTCIEDHGVRVMCLMIDAMAGHQTIIGNYKQQNMRVVYNLDSAMLSFVSAHYNCSEQRKNL